MEYICSGHGHMNYNVIPGVVYRYSRAVCVVKMEQDLKGGMRYKFLSNPCAEMNLDIEGRVKFMHWYVIPRLSALGLARLRSAVGVSVSGVPT
ncbi:hypothetical protein BJV74DRAFT_857092 [Russula compacta]|nr:hypothetical protein BJV74DRAFT_857092 [Russula compacta]